MYLPYSSPVEQQAKGDGKEWCLEFGQRVSSVTYPIILIVSSNAPSLAEIQQEQAGRKPQQKQPQQTRTQPAAKPKVDEDKGFWDYGDEEEVNIKFLNHN